MTKLLITGSREATQEMLAYAREAVRRAKSLLWEVVVGDATGVDQAVIEECDRLGVPVTVHGGYDKVRIRTATGQNIAHPGSYPDRNWKMVESLSPGDHCLAIWDGYSRGTRITFQRAKLAGVQTYVRTFRQTDAPIFKEKQYDTEKHT